MSINKFYESTKDNKNIKVKKNFSVRPTELDVEAVPNVREKLVPEHVTYFQECYKRGDYVEPIVVLDTPTPGGKLAVLEGRHRTLGAIAADLSNDLFVEVRAVPLDEAVEHYGFMLNSDRKEKFTFLEISKAMVAIKRLSPDKTNADLAKERSQSVTAIENYLLCGRADEDTHNLIREGRITGSQAAEYVRKHGVEGAFAAITADLERVANKGAAAPRAKGISKFSHAKCLTVMEILTKVVVSSKDLAKEKGEVPFKLGVEDAKDLVSIIDEYMEHEGLEENPNG